MSDKYFAESRDIVREVRTLVGEENCYLIGVCGSRAVLRDACPEYSDWDVCLLPMLEKKSAVFHALLSHGFTNESDDPRYQNKDTTFVSFRRDNLNVLVLGSIEVYEATVLSTHICRAFNMTAREDRVALHQMVCDKYTPEMLGPVTDIGKLIGDPGVFVHTTELRESVEALVNNDWNYGALLRVYRAIRNSAGY